jgi:hypothetical protein
LDFFLHFTGEGLFSTLLLSDLLVLVLWVPLSLSLWFWLSVVVQKAVLSQSNGKL